MACLQWIIGRGLSRGGDSVGEVGVRIMEAADAKLREVRGE